MTDSRPWVVLLTGGALPGQPAPEPTRLELDLARERGATAEAVAWFPAAYSDLHDGAADVLATESFKIGYERAAKLHEVRAAYLVNGSEELAARVQEWLTREVDPAYRRQVSIPLEYMLGGFQAKDGG